MHAGGLVLHVWNVALFPEAVVGYGMVYACARASSSSVVGVDLCGSVEGHMLC